MKMMTERITELADGMREELVQIYRHLHSWPELGDEEWETSAYIQKQLEGLGFEMKTEISGTGICAFLSGAEDGKTLLIRAEMDALPMEEKTGLFYSSCYTGKMHACGHDAHMAIVLGAAKILSSLKDCLKGNVKLVFQPAEEISTFGGRRMVEAGVLENPKVNAVISTHVWPDIPAGQYGVCLGRVMAATDYFHLELKGKGGHGATPEKCIDPIAMGNEICRAFQDIPIRMAGVLNPVVISVTKFNAGTCNNAFPDTGVLEGTVRSCDEKIQARIPEVMEEIIRAVTERYGGAYEFQYENFSPAVMNNGVLSIRVIKSLKSLYGNNAVVSTAYPSMLGEEFGVYTQKVPGVLFWTGIGNEKKNSVYPLHHPQFTIDEDILSRTAAAMAQITVDYLNQ